MPNTMLANRTGTKTPLWLEYAIYTHVATTQHTTNSQEVEPLPPETLGLIEQWLRTENQAKLLDFLKGEELDNYQQQQIIDIAAKVLVTAEMFCILSTYLKLPCIETVHPDDMSAAINSDILWGTPVPPLTGTIPYDDEI